MGQGWTCSQGEDVVRCLLQEGAIKELMLRGAEMVWATQSLVKAKEKQWGLHPLLGHAILCSREWAGSGGLRARCSWAPGQLSAHSRASTGQGTAPLPPLQEGSLPGPGSPRSALGGWSSPGSICLAPAAGPPPGCCCHCAAPTGVGDLQEHQGTAGAIPVRPTTGHVGLNRALAQRQ